MILVPSLGEDKKLMTGDAALSILKACFPSGEKPGVSKWAPAHHRPVVFLMTHREAAQLV
jgi:hypothetical protein